MHFSAATSNFPPKKIPAAFSTSGSLQRVPEVYEMFGKPKVSFFKRKKNSLLKPLYQYDLKRLEIMGYYG